MREIMELQAEFEKIDAPVLKYFNPGLSPLETKEMFDQIGLTPTEDLIQLYTWRNGLRYEGTPSGKLSFGVNGVFFPLQDSADMYQEYFADSFPSFFPIFSDDSFLINLNAQSEDYQKIFVYSPALLITEPESCYDTLQTMIQTFVTCFQEGIFRYGSDEYFQENNKVAWEVSKRSNSLAEYWR